MNTAWAHCNQCSDSRNHEVLHSEETSWASEDDEYSRTDKYEMLKCLGCNSIKLRHTSWFSENQEPEISYFPPAIYRQRPKWFAELENKLSYDDKFVGKLLVEIYIALQNNLPSLAAMGVRAFIERVMISKAGDQGSFAKNILAFEKLGYVSSIQRERLEAILEVGHATIHRTFTPNTKDVITLVELTEHIVETVYLHEDKIAALKKRVPPRKT